MSLAEVVDALAAEGFVTTISNISLLERGLRAINVETLRCFATIYCTEPAVLLLDVPDTTEELVSA